MKLQDFHFTLFTFPHFTFNKKPNIRQLRKVKSYDMRILI